MAHGDHIFSYRLGYSHHGIDCGDGSVVHFDSDPLRKAASTLSAQRAPRIRRISMDEFGQGQQIQVRNYSQCDPSESVVERAASRIGDEGYDLFQNNCEHFAVWCKTGRPQSTQIDAVRYATRPLRRVAPASAVAWRAVRYIPPAYRPWAVGAALGLTGASMASRYLTHRLRSRNRQES